MAKQAQLNAADVEVAASQMAVDAAEKRSKNRKADSNITKEADKLDEKKEKTLVRQVQAEYELSKAFIDPKVKEWGARLKMYNNQRRDKTAVGDPLIFTTHNTVIAALYDDQLASNFLPRKADDEEVAENLNRLAEFDYDEMDKDILDYEWAWDTGFFGRGLVCMTDFDRATMTPVPYVIDPMVFLRDPRATSINGDRLGRGAARFYGWESLKTKREMEDNPAFFNVHKLNKKKSVDGDQSRIRENKQFRDDAQNLNSQFTNLPGENAEHIILEWWTWWDGKPTLVKLGNNRETIVGLRQFNLPVVRGRKMRWISPVIDRSLYPISHDWDGVSIPDLTEDKQRSRSVVQNLSVESVKAGLFQGYAYDETKIKNRADLDLGMNKHVGVNGNPSNTIVPIQRHHVQSDVQWILETLDTAAQRATATPEIQQGAIGAEKRTLGELQIVERKVDTRFSLSAKLFSSSEKRFWRQWYALYKEHFHSGIDEKIMRFEGEMGAAFRPLTRDNIIAKVDPDVQVESKTLADAQRLNKLQIFSNYSRALDTDPTADRRFILRFMGKLSGLKTEEINRMLPKTADEMHADVENEKLNENKLPRIDIRDDHHAHIMIHSKATDTKAKQAHIEEHKKALMLQRNNPELIPTPPAQQQQGRSERADIEAANFAPRAPATASPRA